MDHDQSVDEFLRSIDEDYGYCKAIDELVPHANDGNERATSWIIGMMGFDDWGVRICAMSALGDIGNEQAVGALIEVIKDTVNGEDELVGAAISELGRIGDERAVEPIIEVMKTHWGWSEVGPMAETVLKEALDWELNDDVRDMVKSALAEKRPTFPTSSGPIPRRPW